MATDKQFTVAGISQFNGEYKVRFANDIMRIKVLAKHGHEDIRLADLEGEFTKLAAARAILALEDFADAAAQATITEYIQDHTPRAPAAPAVKANAVVTAAVKVKVKAAPAVKANAVVTAAVKVKVKAAPAVKVTENEDAPF